MNPAGNVSATSPKAPWPSAVIVTVTSPPVSTGSGEKDLLAVGPSWAAAGFNSNSPIENAITAMTAITAFSTETFLIKRFLPWVPFACAA